MIAEASTAARWVTAWGTSMQCRSSEPALGRPARTFCDQTLRMVIAPQIAGDSVRLRFSNRFQNDDVELDGIWVGSADGETAGAGDNRRVLFGSADRVTVLRGATAISDPVDLAIRPWARLAVSFHVGGPTTLDVHVGASQVSFLTPEGTGACGHDAAGTAFSDVVQSWYGLDGVDVLTTRPTTVLAAFGDSLTDNQGFTPGAEMGWTSQLSRRFAAHRPDIQLSVVNCGIGGGQLTRHWEPAWMDTDQLGRIWTAFGPSGAARFDNDVISRSGVDGLIMFLGGNDLALEGGVSENRVIAAMAGIVARARVSSLAVIGATLPRRHIWPEGSDGARAREAVNHWIRTSDVFDDVVDFDAATADPKTTDLLRQEFTVDGTHYTDAGATALADAFDLDCLASAGRPWLP